MDRPVLPVKKVKFLAELPLAESEDLIRRSEKRTYPNGAAVFAQGDKMPGVFVVSKGMFKVFRSIGKGKIQVLDLIKPGQCIGDVQVFSDGIAMSNAEARGHTDCWLIPATDLHQAVLRNPIVAEVMLRHLAGKLVHLIPLVETLSLHRVPERVAKLILAQLKDAPNKTLVEFRETQEELAQYVGSSREALNRALRLLCDLGFIRSTFPVLHILDQQKLLRFSKGVK